MRGPLHGLAVKLNGLGPLLAGKGLVGLLFHALQVWGQLYLGTTGKESQVRPAKEGQSSLSGSLQPCLRATCYFLGPWDLHCHLEEGRTSILGLGYCNR